MKAIFITGTDTGVGKTFVSTLLLEEYNALGFKTFAIKPIASGCVSNAAGELVNDDALALIEEISIKRPYNQVNPMALKEAIAPHLAAKQDNIHISSLGVQQSILKRIPPEADITVVEGAGGWSVPLNNSELYSDVVRQLKLPVVLVVGIKLGCLNHALLTYENIIKSNTPFIGWVANCLEQNTSALNENIETLKQWIKQPCLGVVPYNNSQTGVIDVELIHEFFIHA
jgi:dethiobiotin synthetase